jgi:hypothetical protein
MVVPVVIGATGVVTKGLKKNLEAVPGKHSIDSLQKTATLGTSRKIALRSETGSLSGGDHRWFKRSSTGEKRRACDKRHHNNNNNNNNNNNYYYYYYYYY